LFSGLEQIRLQQTQRDAVVRMSIPLADCPDLAINYLKTLTTLIEYGITSITLSDSSDKVGIKRIYVDYKTKMKKQDKLTIKKLIFFFFSFFLFFFFPHIF